MGDAARQVRFSVVAGAGGFAAFYEARYAELVRLAAALVGSVDVAEDVTQDAFAGLHRRWDRVDDPLAYVRRSVVNGCTSHHRRTARRRRTPVPVDRPVELGVDERRADELTRSLDRLPARQRAAVVLRYFADLPDAEIAVALRCRPGTVGALLHRGLARLRQEIHR